MTAAIKLALLLAALLLGAWLGYAWRDREADAQLLRIQNAHEQAVNKAMQQGLARAHRIQEIGDAETIRRKAAEAALHRADAAGQRLHNELQSTRAWARNLDSTLAGERAATLAAVDLLTELHGRCSQERRSISRFADEAAAAGKTCERAFDALTDQ
jgi:hypothetical protein